MATNDMLPSEMRTLAAANMNGHPATVHFGLVQVTLGVASLVMNSLILFSLLRRRVQLQNAYYILIFNFSVVDCIKAICSIVQAMKMLNIVNVLGDWAVKLDSYSGLVLRFANIVTILNLLMITLNEYIYISHPLRYASVVTKNRVVGIIIVAWLLSVLGTVGNSLLGSTILRPPGIHIDSECLASGKSFSECVIRSDSSAINHYIYHMAVVVFCLIVLAVTCYTYVCLMRIIGKLMKADQRMKKELEALKPGELAVKENGSALVKGESRKSSKKRSQGASAVRRRKYALVIGSVIGVYAIFLLAYAIVQVLQVVQLQQNTPDRKAVRADVTLPKYIAFTFICLHSLLQPLCYFRVREFRCLIRRALCGRRIRAASLQYETTYTTSQHHRRISEM